MARNPWAAWPDEKLLDLRFCDLDLQLEGTWVEKGLAELHRELEARGLKLKPHAWLSTEWFSPDDVPGIAVPFYLAHPRLMRLERRRMLEVEGGTWDDCLRILRHEAGHAVQHAYQIQRRHAWQEAFGLASKRYPEYYRPNPASRRFVQHLRLYYAQSHPTEDFAETFAVWLQPRALWRKRYADWPALKKLEYVDGLMAELAGVTPPVRTRRRVEPLRSIRKTLREHYDERRAHYTVSYPDQYDRDLRRLFSDQPRHRKHELAARFLRRNRSEIRQLVSRWTGQYQFTLDQVLSDMIGRSQELRLRAFGSERKLRVDFAVLLTVHVMNHLYSDRNWLAM